MRANPTSPGSFLRRTLAALIVLVTSVAAVNVSGSSANPQPALPTLPLPALPTLPGAGPATPTPTGPPGALFGAYVQGDSHTPERQMAAVATRERQIGRRFAINHHFYPWEKEFPTVREEADLRDGRIPMISWNGTFNLRIDLGLQDDLIKSRAAAVKALPGKVLIRWMWEMDGRKKAEDTMHPALYVAAWRRIHDVFAAEGVTNVQWVWCPNATAFRGEDERNAPAYYPGDEYVDWICADGYNWAPGRQGDQWRSFASIYRDFYEWGMARGKPLMVGEFGAQERAPGEKAQWLTDAREALKTQFPGIKAIVYFDANKEHDWRVTSSAETLAAYRDMANDPWFTPDPSPLMDSAAAAPEVRGIPIPIPPVQFVPRTPPKPPSVPPEPPKAPALPPELSPDPPAEPPETPAPPDDPAPPTQR
ncbi:MAG: glycoside hydrolase family 26 protein [Acidimicrobiia bacterium]